MSKKQARKRLNLAALNNVLKERGYPAPLTPGWLASHLDHYQEVIDAYAKLKFNIRRALGPRR